MAYPYQAYGTPQYSEGPIPGSAPQQPGPGADLFNRLGNNHMLDLGMGAADEVIRRTASTYMPGISAYWHNLKVYFMVNNRYVLQKLQVLLLPFPKSVWGRVSMEELDTPNLPDGTTHKYALPIHDVNAPDLYIPLMAFITFVLINGFARGASNNFTPEVLTQSTTMCLVAQIIEVLVMRFVLQLIQVSVPFMDLWAYTGYKYVMLCAITATWLAFGNVVYLITFLYMGAALVYFMLKTLAATVPAANNQGPPRHLIIGALAFGQLLVVWWLGRQ